MAYKREPLQSKADRHRPSGLGWGPYKWHTCLTQDDLLGTQIASCLTDSLPIPQQRF